MVFMGIEWLSTNLIYDVPEDEQIKMQELMLGAIQFFPASYIGEFGQGVLTSFTDRGEVPGEYACFYYDAVLAIAHTFDFMVITG